MLSQFMEFLDMGFLELGIVSECRIWCLIVVQLYSESRILLKWSKQQAWKTLYNSIVSCNLEREDEDFNRPSDSRCKITVNRVQEL